MAYSDAHNVQFLDLSGVDEEEKKMILTSLQIRDSTVKGPWNKLDTLPHGMQKDIPHTNSHVLPQRNYEPYPTPLSVIIRNHVNTIPQSAHQIQQTVFPRPYQQTLPGFPPAFVPSIVAVTTPVVPVVNTMVPVNPPLVPVNAPIVPMNSPILPINQPLAPVVNNPYPQQVTYPSFHIPPININNAYTAPIIKQVHMKHEFANSDQNVEQQLMLENNVENPQTGEDVIPYIEDVQEEDTTGCVENVHTVTNGCDEGAATKSVKSNGSETKSWASLFNKKGNSAELPGEHSEDTNKPLTKVSPFVQNIGNSAECLNTKKSALADFDDPNYYRMGEILVNYTMDNRITSLQPRGLINHSNYCYINSILQAMLACPPVYNLLKSLCENTNLKDNRKHTQVIDNMVRFVNEFHPLPPGQRVNRRSENKLQKKEPLVTINFDRPFEPYWIYKMLNGIRSDSFVVEGRQEDAEEFLGCLLNGLNDEMLELMKLIDDTAPPPAENNDESDKGADGDKEWQVIGPKNKGCVTRRTELVRTPISDIFGGNIRSRLYRAGDNITDNIQPFFTLQLNIEKVNTVREALEALVCKNQLEGVTSSKTNEEVEAWQQVTIEELPVVLILHLKCFDFKLDGCTKIIKALEFPVDLKIDPKLLSSKSNYQAKEKQYKLFAVVYHDGKEATKGHYITDAYHIGYSSWIRYDDTSVRSVKEEDVLKPHGTRVPYLLFYRRSDTVRSK